MKMQEKIYTYIKERNIHLDELSALSGIPKKRLERIFEKGECSMEVDEYVAVCSALSLPVEYFTAG